MSQRRVLLIAHAGRSEARQAAQDMTKALAAQGMLVRLLSDEADELRILPSPGVEVVPHTVDCPDPEVARDCELALVLGGDGTILRAVEATRGFLTPILGVNLGHVGFLAEAEPEDVTDILAAIRDRSFSYEDRLTLAVDVRVNGEVVYRTFALNEASIEKAARQRMLEVVVEVDGRPLSRWGCDGVVCATPTGSTAYNFSAGGPVVWPSVEALLMVPISAHALFARPLVVAPSSELAVEIQERGNTPGVLWCDGRRSFDLPPGARIEVSRADQPVRFARLHQAPFSARLVAKFGLPVDGWRGSSGAAR